MIKYLNIILLSFLFISYGCEELQGPEGPAGTSNMSVIEIEMNTSNTSYVQYDSYGLSTDGYIEYAYLDPNITESVVNEGFIKVEKSTIDNETWEPLPFNYTAVNNSSIEYIYTCSFYYYEGVVKITWECTLDRSESDWLNAENLWSRKYKISIVAP